MRLGPFALLLCATCEDCPPAAPQRRVDAVTAARASARPSASASVVASAGPRRRGPLCPVAESGAAPGELEAARTAPGAARPRDLSYGAGRWIWLNVWAAWCGPCKDELPRLLAWKDQLRAEGVKLELHFVSIDDDEREIDRFLGAQPPNGMRASWWLAEEEPRAAWFGSLGFDEQPQLPVHAFVSPQGKLTCTVTGALEPADYPALAAIFRR